MEVKIGDLIKWGGLFVDDEYLEGENYVSYIYEDDGLLWMVLDNGKKWILKNLKNPTSIPPCGWEIIEKK